MFKQLIEAARTRADAIPESAKGLGAFIRKIAAKDKPMEAKPLKQTREQIMRQASMLGSYKADKANLLG